MEKFYTYNFCDEEFNLNENARYGTKEAAVAAAQALRTFSEEIGPPEDKLIDEVNVYEIVVNRVQEGVKLK